MKQVKNKLSLVLIMALGIIAFGNVLLAHASALPNWFFKTESGITVNVNKTINMNKNEFQDFNLYKSGKEIKQNDSGFHLSWSSDNENVVWIDSANGKARADKFGKMKGDYGEAVITAQIKNKVTKAVTYRRFKVVIGAKNKPKPTATPTLTPQPASVALQIKGRTDASKPLEPNYTYRLETLVYDKNNKQINAGTHTLHFKYFSDKDGIKFTGSDFKATKEGEYTITVGAFRTESEALLATSAENAAFTAKLANVKVQAGPARILQARQVTLNTVKLTLNTADYAKQLVEDNKLLKIECNAKVYTYSAPINTITQDEEDECSVLVQMRSRLTESYEYTYSYDGAGTPGVTIIGSDTTPAAIRLVGGPLEARTYHQLEVKVYNSRGVDISDVTYYSFQFTERNNNWTDFSYQLSGDHIWFASEGKSAVIEVSLDRGYDDKGNKLSTLTSVAQFYSIPKAEPVYARSQMFALADDLGLLIPSTLNYSTTPLTICMGDNDSFIVAAFSYVDDRKSESIQYVASGTDTTGNNYIYSYRSADPSLLLVGETNGNLVPIRTGSTSIYILQHSEFPIEESKGKVVAVVPITVAPERALETFALSEQSSVKLSATGNTNGDEFVSIKLKALDQQGDPVAASYSFSVVEPVGAAFGALFNYKIENNILKIWEGPGLNNFVSKDVPKNIIVTVTASYNNVQRKQNFQLVIRNTKDSMVYASELYLTNSRVDLKLDRADLNSYLSTIQIRSVDSNGYFIRLENLKYVSTATEASTEKDIYSVTITNSVDDTDASNLNVEATDKELKISLLNVKENVITKTASGIYKVTLYRGNGSDAVPVTVKVLEVADSTSPLTIMQKEFSLLYADTSAVKEAITILRGSANITEYVNIHSMKSVQVDDILVVYELYAHVRTQEQNEEWSGEYYTSETIVPATPLLFVLSY